MPSLTVDIVQGRDQTFSLGGLGERRKLPQRGPGRSPAKNDFSEI